jgi:integrase
VVFANLTTLFAAAVNDELIVRNPCRSPSVRKPRAEQRKVIPWTAGMVQAVHDELPERYRIIAVLGAGLGLRQGEIMGPSADDIDFLGKEIRVVRQVKLFGARRVFAPS